MGMAERKRTKLYYFPPRKGPAYGNPYSENFRAALGEKFEVVNFKAFQPVMNSLALFVNAFRADVYILNWLENVVFYRLGSLQFLLAKLSLKIIGLRRKKIVWMFHNITPHVGHSKNSMWLYEFLFKHAALIVSHSKEATAYARARAECKVLYVCHPVHEVPVETAEADLEVEQCDVLIWGAVLPYKGIFEFLAQAVARRTELRIRVLGACEDSELAKKIEGLCSDKITFENRRASFAEIEKSVKCSCHVLFPYVGRCVSSSGALIDTVVMGGNPVGPEVGAFKDLTEEGVCATYRDYDELFRLLEGDSKVDSTAREEFVKNNTWKGLAETIVENL